MSVHPGSNDIAVRQTRRSAPTNDLVEQPNSASSQSAAETSTSTSTTAAAAAAAPTLSTQGLWGYFLLTYVVLLINTAGYLSHLVLSSLLETAFAVAALVTYTSLYLLPALLIVFLVRWVTGTRLFGRNQDRRRSSARWMVYAAAIVSCTLVQYLIFADKTVFGVFGFHLNGFIWNLVLTKGGIESMGGGSSTLLLGVAVGVGFLLIQSLLLWLVTKVLVVRRLLARFSSRRAIVVGACCMLFVAATEQIGFGISSFRNYSPVLAAADVLPCFVPTTFAKLALSMGYEVERTPTMAGATDSARLRYPLHAIRLDRTVKPPNIVWLVSESLRADMLTPEIMPNAWKLSQRSSRFEHHYSGGNGTRMGMFSMFYGLYGPYWFSFLGEQRGPVLVDTLIDLNYQMDLYTSAMFSYPEFDQTLFSRLPSDHLHQGGGRPAWRQDQRHINSMLRFIEQRDHDRPFMVFEFFESPHANYSFSKKAIIRRPYADNINYLSMDLHRDIGLMKNRYINACHQIDLEIGRVLAYLSEHDLMNSTMLLITGDHGEEFMEKGRWGHNSEFTEEQTRVPFVLWVPGKPARVVTHMTSHLDVPATIMPLLGVLNPPEDYSQGYDLFGTQARKFTVISAWNHVAYVDEHYKATFPTSAVTMFQQTVTTADDAPIADRAAFYEEHQRNIVEIMRGLKTFRK